MEIMQVWRQEERTIRMSNNSIYINTCLFGDHLSRVQEYAQAYGGRLGFEILAMFDMPDFEQSLRENLALLQEHPVAFHGPVFRVEHAAPRGTRQYEESMHHVRLTLKYARILRSRHFTMHLNNGRVDPDRREEMLANAHENYKELQEMFGSFDCPVYIENTGTILQKNMLLDQQEFTQVCRDKKYDVLIDIGHANANGWDIPRLIDDLQPQIRAYHLHNNDGIHDQHNRLHEGTIDFTSLLDKILKTTPDADLIIEYTRREKDGAGLHEDIWEVLETCDKTRE